MGESERTEWDDLKNARSIAERRIDFSDPDEVFDGRFALVVQDRRHDDGETRFNMLVALRGLILNVTFTPRPPRHRIISARLASRKERRIDDVRQQGR